MSTESQRVALSRHLIGAGIELGPGHNPYPVVLPGVSVQYVDRWSPDTNRDLFPELGSAAPFPKPDIVANLDTDFLSAIGTQSRDFVICSHILEHLANPIGQLVEVHRVLRPGGVALILLPDRHRTFDRLRTATSLEHVVAEYQGGVTEVDDDHIIDFLRATTDEKAEAGADGSGNKALLDLHRRRSIHAHCWDQDEFFPLIEYCVENLDQRWQFVDGLLTAEGGPANIEFGFVLRRSSEGLTTDEHLERLRTSWIAWRQTRLDCLAAAGYEVPTSVADFPSPVMTETQRNKSAMALELALARCELAAIRSRRTYKVLARGKRLSDHLAGQFAMVKERSRIKFGL